MVGDGVARIHGSRAGLDDVQVGDLVRAGHGSFAEVLKEDFGAPQPERYDDFVCVRTDLGKLVLTADHVIGGRPAAEWRLREQMFTPIGPAIVRAVEEHAPVASGDLCLDGAPNYIANGLLVTSMLEKRGGANEPAEAVVGVVGNSI